MKNMKRYSIFVKFKIISEFQYAYMKGKSVALAIFYFINAICYLIDQSQHTIGTFYDFSKAFDMVVHDILFQKLSSLGVNGVPLKLIKSYLLNRQYYVQISHTNSLGNICSYTSKVKEWNLGVPQGGIFGPYGFLVMINDLPDYLMVKLLNVFKNNYDSLISIYADDVNLILSQKNLDVLKNICNEAISITQEWCTKNKLILNESKTNFVQFHSAHSRVTTVKIDLKHGNNPIQNTVSNIFLGLRLNEYLDWTNQVDHICSKIRSGIYILGKLKNEVSFSVLRTVYFSHVYSHIRNNVIFWGHCSYANRVFLLQKRAIRTIYNVSKITSCSSLFTDFSVLTFPSVYILECILFVKRHLDLFEVNSDVHDYNTRSSVNLRTIKHRKTFLEKGPKYRLIHLYNKLPLDIKKIENFKGFKKSLYAYLFNLNLYSVHDF